MHRHPNLSFPGTKRRAYRYSRIFLQKKNGFSARKSYLAEPCKCLPSITKLNGRMPLLVFRTPSIWQSSAPWQPAQEWAVRDFVQTLYPIPLISWLLNGSGILLRWKPSQGPKRFLPIEKSPFMMHSSSLTWRQETAERVEPGNGKLWSQDPGVGKLSWTLLPCASGFKSPHAQSIRDAHKAILESGRPPSSQVRDRIGSPKSKGGSGNSPVMPSGWRAHLCSHRGKREKQAKSNTQSSSILLTGNAGSLYHLYLWKLRKILPKSEK